jgi:two-component SAPR family response regulator
MVRLLRYFLFVLLILVARGALCQSHGLRFSSHEVVPEKRTSLNLTPDAPLCLQQDMELSFDLTFTPNKEIYFGYIMRLVTTNNQNIDIVYNQRLERFNFVIGETVSGEFNIAKPRLYGQWSRFTVKLFVQQQEAHFFLDNKFIAKGKVNIPAGTCCRIFFGTNDFHGIQALDIPPMGIKDIRISGGGKEVAYYPLWESTGLQAINEVNKKAATVKNPVWIKPRHQKWEQAAGLNTKGAASVAFDKNAEVIYIVGQDSLLQLSIRNMQWKKERLSAPHDSVAPGNQSVFNAITNTLYNFDIDAQQVSTYHPGTAKWDINFLPGELTVFWQANKFLSAADSSLYIIGGYGQLRYKNMVQRYRFSTKEWDTIYPEGDAFMPRYLAALGTNGAGDTAYILGGYGSKTGDQTINPRFTYDLMAYSVKSGTFKNLLHLKDPTSQFCFANSMVIDTATRDYYALSYPIDRFNSSLQLIKGSLQSPDYQLLGDTIPYAFHDIESFADLYYCAVSKKLVAVTLFTSANNMTSVKVYTLDFPPNALDVVVPPAAKASRDWMYFLLAGVLVAAGLFFVMRRKKKEPVAGAGNGAGPLTTPVKEGYHALQPLAEERRDSSAIYLFGQLEVFDKEGHDITKMFTPLLKELFLLVLIHTFRDGKGIASEKLYEILWGDKPAKDARNNFSVNVVKLKGILEKVGDCHISKDSGKWKLDILHDSMLVDYQRYRELVGVKPEVNKQYVNALLSVVGKGPFLSTVHYNWLDDIKSEVSGRTIDILLNYISTADLAAEAEFIIKVTNTIFFFDQLNEEALVYKCKCLVLLGRHGMAKDAYLKFAKEYKENYGQDYERSFAEMTGGEK